ncbi:LysR family transcriptional regulator [Sinorhizobium sp. 8-89]|uniref:LysR family transcriptional regulator n=1 Tax=Sinorhizobium sp. 7-81 TaxID=3049087 RepID=UPI0024C2BC4C|nr:LysR family transcriptional regulator [Sinorhizobium sp. 7-81]MDK1387981.1 LysR family transcriptional regulator [Sinorhizobium sp. 7-81]
MDWNDLRYFLAVARTGSLSAATRELGTSQATIGRRVQALETALGAVLFERLNTGYVLTSAGREIQARAEAAEASVLAVARGVDRELGQVQGSVRLATGEALASHLIAPRASSFRATYSALRLEFVTGFRAVSLSRHEADLALRLIRPDQGDYIRRKVGVVGFGLYASAALVDAHPALRCDPWSVDFVGWDASMRDVPMAGWIKGQALDRIVATATSMNVQLALARASLGAALLPCFVADSVPDLVRLAGPSDVGILDLWVVVHRDLSRVPRVRAVLDFVGGLCEQESARLRGV